MKVITGFKDARPSVEKYENILSDARERDYSRYERNKSNNLLQIMEETWITTKKGEFGLKTNLKEFKPI